MRIVIVGGGTAGHMALAHVSKHWPDAQLIHLFDSRRPTIGVGEGTTPDFVNWLESLGIGFQDLVDHCQATQKRGLQFEGWGSHQAVFEHEFLPRSQQAVHFSAAKLPGLLTAKSRFRRIDDSLRCINQSQQDAIVITENGRRIEADLVIDSRGFPAEPMGEVHRFDWITTDCALVTKSPVPTGATTTRAIARPLGWVFSIPLADETSFGYVYNSRLTTRDEVTEDFGQFLRQQGVGEYRSPRDLRFPNFARRNIFDGRVYHIGNCASFLEPLEATAIGVITLQLQLLSHWQTLRDQGVPSHLAAHRVNRIHEDTLVKVSLFIAWHYAAGSQYDTPFWENAQRHFQRSTQLAALSDTFAKFDAMQVQGNAVDLSTLGKLNTTLDMRELNRDDAPQANFGGYSKWSFAQLAHGLGLKTQRSPRNLAS